MNDELFNLIKNENDHLRDLVLDYKVMLDDFEKLFAQLREIAEKMKGCINEFGSFNNEVKIYVREFIDLVEKF
jgi:hypothetical protein